jgi:hypothetical protein
VCCGIFFPRADSVCPGTVYWPVAESVVRSEGSASSILVKFPTDGGSPGVAGDMIQDRTYIDYFKSSGSSQRGLANRFGLRVKENYFTIMDFADDPPRIISKEFQIPVEFEDLPSYARLVVDDHQANCHASDLMDLLTGKKSFAEAFDSPATIEVKKAITNQQQLSKAS